MHQQSEAIGLAHLNFESSNGWFPPDVDYLAPPYLPDTDPSTQGFGSNPGGQEDAGNFTRILPFLEQQNVYNTVNFNRGAFDQINVPPIVGYGVPVHRRWPVFRVLQR